MSQHSRVSGCPGCPGSSAAADVVTLSRLDAAVAGDDVRAEAAFWGVPGGEQAEILAACADRDGGMTRLRAVAVADAAAEFVAAGEEPSAAMRRAASFSSVDALRLAAAEPSPFAAEAGRVLSSLPAAVPEAYWSEVVFYAGSPRTRLAAEQAMADGTPASGRAEFIFGKLKDAVVGAASKAADVASKVGGTIARAAGDFDNKYLKGGVGKLNAGIEKAADKLSRVGNKDEGECDWITIQGPKGTAKICIGTNGVIMKGPKELTGREAKKALGREHRDAIRESRGRAREKQRKKDAEAEAKSDKERKAKEDGRMTAEGAAKIAKVGMAVYKIIANPIAGTLGVMGLQFVNKNLGFLRKAQAKMEKRLTGRYGAAGAKAIMFAGVGSSIAATMLTGGAAGVGLAITPGLHLACAMPFVAVAEGLHTGAKVAKATGAVAAGKAILGAFGKIGGMLRKKKDGAEAATSGARKEEPAGDESHGLKPALAGFADDAADFAGDMPSDEVIAREGDAFMRAMKAALSRFLKKNRAGLKKIDVVYRAAKGKGKGKASGDGGDGKDGKDGKAEMSAPRAAYDGSFDITRKAADGSAETVRVRIGHHGVFVEGPPDIKGQRIGAVLRGADNRENREAAKAAAHRVLVQHVRDQRDEKKRRDEEKRAKSATTLVGKVGRAASRAVGGTLDAFETIDKTLLGGVVGKLTGGVAAAADKLNKVGRRENDADEVRRVEVVRRTPEGKVRVRLGVNQHGRIVAGPPDVKGKLYDKAFRGPENRENRLLIESAVADADVAADTRRTSLQELQRREEEARDSGMVTAARLGRLWRVATSIAKLVGGGWNGVAAAGGVAAIGLAAAGGVKFVNQHLGYLNKVQEKMQRALSKRYGAAGAGAIMFSGLTAAGAGALLTPGLAGLGMAVLPGVHLAATLPAIAAAEGIRVLAKGSKVVAASSAGSAVAAAAGGMIRKLKAMVAGKSAREYVRDEAGRFAEVPDKPDVPPNGKAGFSAVFSMDMPSPEVIEREGLAYMKKLQEAILVSLKRDPAGLKAVADAYYAAGGPDLRDGDDALVGDEAAAGFGDDKEGRIVPPAVIASEPSAGDAPPAKGPSPLSVTPSPVRATPSVMPENEPGKSSWNGALSRLAYRAAAGRAGLDRCVRRVKEFGGVRSGDYAAAFAARVASHGRLLCLDGRAVTPGAYAAALEAAGTDASFAFRAAAAEPTWSERLVRAVVGG